MAMFGPQGRERAKGIWCAPAAMRPSGRVSEDFAARMGCG